MRFFPPWSCCHPPRLQQFQKTYAFLARMESIIFQSSPSDICICFCVHRSVLLQDAWHGIPNMGSFTKPKLMGFPLTNSLLFEIEVPSMQSALPTHRFNSCSLFVPARRTTAGLRSNRRGRCKAACHRAPPAPDKDFRPVQRASR